MEYLQINNINDFNFLSIFLAKIDNNNNEKASENDTHESK